MQDEKIKNGKLVKLCANWVTGHLMSKLNKTGLAITQSPVSADQLGGLLKRVNDGTISNRMAKVVFDAMWDGEGTADEIIDARGLKQLCGTVNLSPIINEIMVNHPVQLEEFRAGKDKLFGFFVGQVMKATQGKANPQQVNDLLKQKLCE